MNSIEKLQTLIDESKKIVFFGGAGVSTESGIPDFRSVDGLYNQAYKYPPEEILSDTFFATQTKEFYRFYRDKMLFLNAKPNPAHLKLAEMEQKGKLIAVVTQNIDGLHQAAGSKNVYELHGSVLRNHCIKCSKKYNVDVILQATDLPICDCGGIIKPDVVLYGESLDSATMSGAIASISKSDLLIIGGTSLSVYPAAGLVQYCRGKIIVINKSHTQMDSQADLLITAPIGETLNQICL